MSMSSSRSKRIPSKVSLSVNTVVANCGSNKSVFDADQKYSSPEKSGVEASKKARSRHERKAERINVRLFKDSDAEVKALERSHVQAQVGARSSCQAGDWLDDNHKLSSKPMNHTRRLSIHSHPDSETSTETVKPCDRQDSSDPANIATYGNTRITDEAKAILAARIRKAATNDENQQQSQRQLFSIPNIMMEISEGNRGAHSNPTKGMEGAIHLHKSNLEPSNNTMTSFTLPPEAPAKSGQPTSPTSTYSKDSMKISRKTVGSGSSKSTSASATPGETSPVDSPAHDFESNWSLRVPPVGCSPENETLTDEEIRRRHMRHAAYNAFMVISPAL